MQRDGIVNHCRNIQFFEMCAQLEDRRERLGISYVTCAAEMMGVMAPVVARLAGR